MRQVAFLSCSVLLAIALASCKQQAGDRCNLDSDCADGLICCVQLNKASSFKEGICSDKCESTLPDTGVPDLGKTDGLKSDAKTSDAKVMDLPTVDKAAPDTNPVVDTKPVPDTAPAMDTKPTPDTKQTPDTKAGG